MPERPPGASFAWRRIAVQALVLLVLVGAAYLPATRAGFIWDDDDYVELNDLLVSDDGLAQIWNPFSTRNPQYYPLVFTTFRIERALYGLNPVGYHVVNIVLHLLNAVLLLLLMRRAGVPWAFFVAALFAVHPVHVESVAWITERKNVLSTLFYLLAFLAYLRFDTRRRWDAYALSLICFALALLSKTVTASLPVAIGLLLWWSGARLTLRRLAPLIPMLLIGFGMGLVTRSHEFLHVLGGESVLDRLGPVDRLLVAGRAFWFYPFKILWPIDLAFIYERWDIEPADPRAWLAPLAVVALALWLSIQALRDRVPRGAVASVAFYGVTIFPALGFVNVAPMRFASVADHFQYLASLGTLLFVVGALRVLTREGRAFPAPVRFGAAALIVLALVALSHRQARHYRDPGTLWAHTARLSPGNSMVQNNYGAWLRGQDRPDEAADRFERALSSDTRLDEDSLIALTNLAGIRLGQNRASEALELAERAAAIKADHPFVLNVRGRALWRLGRLDEAERTLAQLLAMDAERLKRRALWDVRRRINDANVRSAVGHIQREDGRESDAERSFRDAIEIDPDELSAYLGLQSLYLSQRRFEEAESVMRQAVARAGDVAIARVELARAAVATGRYESALEQLDRALSLDPDHAQAHRIRIQLLRGIGRHGDAIAAMREGLRRGIDTTELTLQLAWELATAPQARDRNGSEALRLVGAFVDEPQATARQLSTVAAAQAETGDFASAVGTIERALAVEGSDPRLLALLRTQAAGYREGRPTRAGR